MAITYSNRVGRTRIRLAQMLGEAMPEYKFEPHDLQSQNPVFIRRYGCCAWYGIGYRVRGEGRPSIDVTSWDRMRDCVRYGFESGLYDNVGDTMEIHQIEPKQKKESKFK